MAGMLGKRKAAVHEGSIVENQGFKKHCLMKRPSTRNILAKVLSMRQTVKIPGTSRDLYCFHCQSVIRTGPKNPVEKFFLYDHEITIDNIFR